MNLQGEAYLRVERLLAKHEFGGGLDAQERAELRALLTLASPRAPKMEWERLVEYGFILVGARHLGRALARQA